VKTIRTISAVLCLLLAGPVFAGSWKQVESKRGVTAYMSENPKTGLPIIRVRTRIAASLPEVLGVVTDINNSCSWAGRCAEARVIRRDGPFKNRVYSRRKGPWPVSDRDFELDSEVKITKHGKQAVVRFWQVKRPLIKPRSGVVRVPIMRGYYKLVAAGPGATDYEFQVEADPGGWIPRWVYKWSAKSGPFESARNLRKRVPRVRARYAAFVKRFEAVAATLP